jgi:peptidoglycan/xylan/chitin deacetylase (PgdA/CDA1 family)
MKGAGYIKKVFHVLRRQFKPGGVILLYHRVASLSADPHSLAVSPEHFAQQLEHIHDTCYPMRLLDLLEAMQQRSLPQRALAITFDDGYWDNYEHAYPLLKSAGIPATIFVTSEQVDSEREFWWDDLERLLLLPQQLPEHLRISVGDQEYEWRLDSVEQRRCVHQAIHNLLRPLDADTRDEVLDGLANWVGLEQSGRSDYRAMTTGELIELAQSKCVDIGGHTMSHPVLSTLSAEAQYGEIIGGRQRLESIIGRRVSTFAYPYGASQDFTDETAEIVREAGFQSACTTIPGSIEAGDDQFRLRRCPVFDWDTSTFKQQLESYFINRE